MYSDFYAYLFLSFYNESEFSNRQPRLTKVLFLRYFGRYCDSYQTYVVLITYAMNQMSVCVRTPY